MSYSLVFSEVKYFNTTLLSLFEYYMCCENRKNQYLHVGINPFEATSILIFELWLFVLSSVLVQPGCVCFLYRLKRCQSEGHVSGRAEFETLTAARQSSNSRWRYSVPPCCQDRADREDNKARPPNSVYLDSTSAVILDERDHLGPENVWAFCLFVSVVNIHTCLKIHCKDNN